MSSRIAECWKGCGLWAHTAWFKSCLCHLLSALPQVGYLTSMPQLPLLKNKNKLYLPTKAVVTVKWANMCEMLE